MDSGNLAGSLLTLQAGLLELKDLPVLPANMLQGLQDTLQVLAEHVDAQPTPELAQKIRLLQDTLGSHAHPAATSNAQPQTLADADHLLEEMQRTGGSLVAWLSADIDIDGELYYWAQAFEQQARALRDELHLLVPEPGHFSNIPTLAELARATQRWHCCGKRRFAL